MARKSVGEVVRDNIAAVLGAGATGLFVASIFGAFAAALGINMLIVHGCLICAWVILSGALISSETFWRLPSKRHPLICVLSGIYLSGAVLLILDFWLQQKAYEQTHLVPDTLPAPATSCKRPADDWFAVFLGGTTVSFFKVFPHVVISYGRYPSGRPYAALEIDKSDNRVLIKTMRIFGDDGSIISRIDDGEIWVDSRFRNKKPNSHKIQVFDNKDREVLSLHYLNSNTIYITGILQKPGGTTLTIAEDRISINGSGNVSGCSTGSAIDFMVGDTPPG